MENQIDLFETPKEKPKEESVSLSDKEMLPLCRDFGCQARALLKQNIELRARLTKFELKEKING